MLFSIILPSYNSLEYISDTLTCILQQSFQDFELIIIDDCSTDASYDVLCAYQEYDARIRLLRNSCNKGVAYSRNIGIDSALGDYIIFWDCDDLASPNRLLVQSQVVEKFDDDVFYSDYYLIDSFGNILFCKRVPEILTKLTFYRVNPIPNLSALIKRSAIEDVRFRLDVRHEDSLFYYDLFLLKRRFKKVRIENHFYYRYHQKSLSGNKLQSLTWRFHNLRKDHGLSFHYSIVCYLHYFFENLYKNISVKFRYKLMGILSKPLK